MKLIIGNSFTELKDTPNNVYLIIKEALTYKDDSVTDEIKAIFGKMNYAKSRGNQGLYNKCKGRLKQLKKLEIVCWLDNNTFPTGHLNIVKDILGMMSVSYDIIEERVNPGKTCILRWNNKPFEPRYYQKEVIEKAISHGRGVVESAVGTGKSLMMAYIIKELSVNTLIIVPSRGLLEQMYQDLVLWFGGKNVDMVNSTKVRSGKTLKPIRITTIQTVASLVKSGEEGGLLEDTDALFMDEFHHAGSSSYTTLLGSISNIYFRFGFTGTFLRNDSKILDMFGVLSTRIYHYPAHKAILEGYLTPLQVISYNLTGKSHKQYQKEYDLNYCWPDESERPRDIHKQILSIVEENDGQILILVDKKDKSGLKIKDYLWCHGIQADYISGDNKKEEIYEAIEDFNEKKNRVLIGSKVIGEGIDIRSTDHLINAQGGKSEISLVQACGRAIRLYPGKAIATVHDFNFINTNYLHKHYNKRIDTYKRNFEPKFRGINGEEGQAYS